jgi:hypothetical protein
MIHPNLRGNHGNLKIDLKSGSEESGLLSCYGEQEKPPHCANNRGCERTI